MALPHQRIESQFHPLTAELAKEWYSKKYLTTAGYLVAIKKIIRPPGVELRINNVVAFCKEWEISKSAFYRAVDTLKDEFEWEATHGLVFRERNSTGEVIKFPKRKSIPQPEQVSHKRDTNSRNRDTNSHNRDTNSRNRDTNSRLRENECSKPAQGKRSSTPSDYSYYSDFIQTLSDRERESFERFVKEEWRKNKKEDIHSIERFLKSQEDFDTWYHRFSLSAVGKNFFWEKHPLREQWLAEIEQTGNPAMFAETEEQQEFVKWAWDTKQFSWLKEDIK